jgi:hypothetical protein
VSAVTFENPSIFFLASLVPVVGFLWLIKRGYEREIGSLEELRSEAHQVLESYETPTLNDAIRLVGRDAQIVNKEEMIGWFNNTAVVSYGLTLLLRNKQGEYFMFLYRHGEKPFVKHTPQSIARAKLGPKYLAPPFDA